MKQNRIKTLLIRYGTQSCNEEHRLKHHREIDIKILSTCIGIIYIYPHVTELTKDLLTQRNGKKSLQVIV